MAPIWPGRLPAWQHAGASRQHLGKELALLLPSGRARAEELRPQELTESILSAYAPWTHHRTEEVALNGGRRCSSRESREPVLSAAQPDSGSPTTD